MTQVRQFGEPRSQVLFRFTAAAIRNSHHNDASFATAVAEAYMARVAPEERRVQFHVGTDTASIVKAGARNAKIIERYRNGTVNLPADLEEAWIAALPEPWATDCARELAHRYGFMGAVAPVADAADPAALCTARMCLEFGQSLEALAMVKADGVVDARDIAGLRLALKESRDLMAAVATYQASLDQRLQQLAPAAVSAEGRAT